SSVMMVGFGICGLGFLAQVVCAVRWLRRRDPPAITSQQSRVLDLAEQLGEMPAGQGAAGFLARLPGNQAFQVEFTEKQIHLPTLPAAWDGLTILLLTDWHMFGTPDRRFYEEVTRVTEQIPADLICFTGDLLDDMDCLDWLPGTLGRFKAPLGKFYIL